MGREGRRASGIEGLRDLVDEDLGESSVVIIVPPGVAVVPVREGE